MSLVGNRRFRICIENNLKTYEMARSKHERSMVVTTIVDAIRECQSWERGGFVRKDTATGRWYEVGDKTAREKVGHALRDAIKLRNRETKHDDVEPETDHEMKQRPKRRRLKEPSAFDSVLSNNNVLPFVQSPMGLRAPTATRKLSNARECAVLQVAPIAPVFVETEWEKSLKESIEHFQDSDDESDSGDSALSTRALQTFMDQKTPVPIYSDTFLPPNMDKVHGNHGATGAVSKSPVDVSLCWNPPGFSDADDHFASYMFKMGQPIESTLGVLETSITTPFPTSDPHIIDTEHHVNGHVNVSNNTATVSTSYGAVLVKGCSNDFTFRGRTSGKIGEKLMVRGSSVFSLSRQLFIRGAHSSVPDLFSLFHRMSISSTYPKTTAKYNVQDELANTIL